MNWQTRQLHIFTKEYLYKGHLSLVKSTLLSLSQLGGPKNGPDVPYMLLTL
jgi:hypothetical protein